MIHKTKLVSFVAGVCLASSVFGQTLEELEEAAFRAAGEKVAPSVVQITTFGGAERVGKFVVGDGPTRGLVVSSAFNFVQNPASILVTLPNGERAAAKILARDNNRMLVVLKVNTTTPLVVPELVPRDQMMVGQWAIAVGKTFDPKQANLSVGVLSATNRVWGKAIQTDAKISPHNYGGPLVDIQGRVLGVLVPMSPDASGELAGTEWYDSGIGFAVPLTDTIARLDTLKSGKDLEPGIMGVTFRGSNVYADAAVIGEVRPNSPAYGAGFKPGDTIVEVDGAPIVRQAQLKHALGGRYAGDSVNVVVTRGEDRIQADLTLTDKLLPYEHPFIGMLPQREPDSEGLKVRFVYPDSPAGKAGLQAGDLLLGINDQEVKTRDDAYRILAAYQPGETIKLKTNRGMSEVTLAALPTEIPATLPAAVPAAAEAVEPNDMSGVVEVKVPEQKNDCFAYVPEITDATRQYGVLVWIHAAAEFDRDATVAAFRSLCDQYGVILVLPKAQDLSRWTRTEVEFIGKAVADVMGTYNVDPTRVVAGGYEAGGAMAYLTALANLDTIRGVVPVDAPLPRLVRVPANDPLKRLALFSIAAGRSQVADRLAATSKAWAEAKFPVTELSLQEDEKRLGDTERVELFRWLDTLDRI